MTARLSRPPGRPGRGRIGPVQVENLNLNFKLESRLPVAFTVTVKFNRACISKSGSNYWLLLAIIAPQ